PDHRDRDHCDRRDEAKELGVRLEDLADSRKRSHREADRDSCERAEKEADQDAAEADGDVLQQDAGPDKNAGLGQHLTGWREKRRADEVDRSQMPDHEEARETDEVSAIAPRDRQRVPSGCASRLDGPLPAQRDRLAHAPCPAAFSWRLIAIPTSSRIIP